MEFSFTAYSSLYWEKPNLCASVRVDGQSPSRRQRELHWEGGVLAFWHRPGLSLGKLFKANTHCCGLSCLWSQHCFCCMQWGKTQTSSSCILPLPPCNFCSAESSAHLPHITAPLTPSKHRMPSPPPQHGLNIQHLLLLLHAPTQHALPTTGFPLPFAEDVFVCMHAHLFLQFVWDHPSLWWPSTTCIFICGPQM